MCLVLVTACSHNEGMVHNGNLTAFIQEMLSKGFSMPGIKVGLLVKLPSETLRGEMTKLERTEDTM